MVDNDDDDMASTVVASSLSFFLSFFVFFRGVVVDTVSFQKLQPHSLAYHKRRRYVGVVTVVCLLSLSNVDEGVCVSVTMCNRQARGWG